MMKKNFLTDDIRELIITPERWKVILPQKGSHAGENKNTLTPLLQTHEHREIMLALAGTCTYGFDGDYYQCTPGTLFLVDHNIEHEYFHLSEAEQLLHLWTFALKDHRIVVRCIAINHDNFQVISSVILPPSSGLDWEVLWDQLDQASTPAEKAHRLQFFKLAIALRLGQFLEAAELSRDQYHLLVVESALEKIQAGFSNGINVARLARSFGYTRFHFARIFRQVTGGTIQDYIDQCRLKKLEEMRGHEFLQKEIASQLGFENARSYYKWRQKYLPNKFNEFIS